MTRSYRISLLECPGNLEHQGLLFQFVFIANNIAGFRGGNLNYFAPDIANKSGFRVAERRLLQRILILNFVVFALRWYAPTVQDGHLLARRIEIDGSGAAGASARTKNLVCLAHVGPDF